MFFYTIICILQFTMIVIFRAENVTCNNRIKEKCISQISNVFNDNTTAEDCMKFAILHLSTGMPLITENFYALRYYYELIKHLTEGDVNNLYNYCEVEYAGYNWNVIYNELLSTFGGSPKEIVLHTYLNETVNNQNNSFFKNHYINYIADEFGRDGQVDMLYPSNFCEKEQVENMCLTQIRDVFGECKSENECIVHAMSHLQENSPTFAHKDYAMFYYKSLENRLSTESFLASVDSPMTFYKFIIGEKFMETIEDPVKFFNNYLNITNDEFISHYDASSAEAYKLPYVLHVFRKEVIEENASTSSSAESSKKSLMIRIQNDKQLYIRHICCKCESFNFQIPENRSPDFYCNMVRQNTNEGIRN